VNGPHDMGGMQSFGPVVPEADEPWFHAEWERRAFALTLAMGGTGQWNLDQVRSVRESIPPARYLASTYYQIWVEGLRQLMLARGLVTADELADGRMRERPREPVSVLALESVAPSLAAGRSTARTAVAPARFSVGDAVRTRELNPASHTRLPRYCRDKRGTISLVHGAHVFADTNALGLGDDPQWLYSVRFDATALWGPDTTASAVHVDCFEPYLERAE
jgi:nitrile hydratase subunit beta